MWQKCDNVTLNAWLINHVITMNCKDRRSLGCRKFKRDRQKHHDRQDLRDLFVQRVLNRSVISLSDNLLFGPYCFLIGRFNHTSTSDLQEYTENHFSWSNQFCLIHLYKMNFQQFRTLFHTATILFGRRPYTTILNGDPQRRSYTVQYDRVHRIGIIRIVCRLKWFLWTNDLFVRSWIWPSGSDPGSWAFLTILEIPSKA